jgi:hypothetical protein
MKQAVVEEGVAGKLGAGEAVGGVDLVDPVDFVDLVDGSMWGSESNRGFSAFTTR